MWKILTHFNELKSLLFRWFKIELIHSQYRYNMNGSVQHVSHQMKLVHVSDCWSVRLCSIEFDYVRWLKCSITAERSIAFDGQNFFVSSIKFDCRTQSNPIGRLGSITERSIDYAGGNLVRASRNFFSAFFFGWWRHLSWILRRVQYSPLRCSAKS